MEAAINGKVYYNIVAVKETQGGIMLFTSDELVVTFPAEEFNSMYICKEEE